MPDFKFKSGELVDRLLEELTRLKEAEKLLGDVWLQVDPYSGKFREYMTKNDAMSPELVDSLRRFFDFDDSE